ncbi:MAG: mechanosensitive ion channel family protein [Bacteroidaceae bacterium]|nr:mechanosensitive ion channel family protein [Bacteroidaceae bacterium]
MPQFFRSSLTYATLGCCPYAENHVSVSLVYCPPLSMQYSGNPAVREIMDINSTVSDASTLNGTEIEKVRQTVLDLIKKDGRILTEPAPFIALSALADSSVNITIRVWVKNEDYWGVFFDMNQNIYEVFNREGISFPFPQVTVHQA